METKVDKRKAENEKLRTLKEMYLERRCVEFGEKKK